MEMTMVTKITEMEMELTMVTQTQETKTVF